MQNCEASMERFCRTVRLVWRDSAELKQVWRYLQNCEASVGRFCRTVRLVWRDCAEL